ncbi:hypothetical protein [Vibrio nigripulchritudo]|uniref:hypothetical protein n=1 Tax=Vibrio nigripulchritudo TaxID=28173 RepID=UPI0005FA0B22|nr:hypothetical protein [Vibrio nigripulchritudo]KJY79101.1 hypothetical protein TW74_10460 [Vibrio nigripulchritudo]
MNKTTLALLIGASIVSVTSFASELNNLQGYYKSKASISHTAKKIQQNKVEFMNLDEALKTLSPGNSPQTLRSISDIANGKGQVYLDTYKKFNLSNKVCVVSKDGSTIAFEANDGDTSCSFNAGKVSKAMAKSSKGLTFYQQFGTGSNAQYSIDRISADGSKLSSSFLFSFKGQLVGEVAIVNKALNSGLYTVEHYSDYGSADGDKYAYKAYQWTNEFSENSDATVNTFSQLSATNVPPYYWAATDTVKKVPVTSNAEHFTVSQVQQFQQPVSGGVAIKYNYSAADPGDLIAYIFNNENRLVGLSPDACTIKQIADGKSPVVWYKGWNRGTSCGSAGANSEKVSSTTLLNDASKAIPVNTLQSSAKTAIEAVGNLSTSNSQMTDQQFNALKVKYESALKTFSNFNSLEFWK